MDTSLQDAVQARPVQARPVPARPVRPSYQRQAQQGLVDTGCRRLTVFLGWLIVILDATAVNLALPALRSGPRHPGSRGLHSGG